MALRVSFKWPALLLSALLLNACTLQDEAAEDAVVDTRLRFTEETFPQGSPEEAFLQEAGLCIAGDLTGLSPLIETYRSTYRLREGDSALRYQKYSLNRAFEKCAMKALQLKDNRAFEAMLTRPGQCAGIAQRFYEKGDLINGAFWMQRVINVQGQAAGYFTLGNRFIRRPATLSMGAKMLQLSARLGNQEASNTLLSLIRPSTPVFQEVTGAIREEFVKERRKLQEQTQSAPEPSAAGNGASQN